MFNTLSVRYDDNDRFGGKVTYRVAPAYVIEDTGTKFKASVGTGFKAPTLSQMFQNFPEFGFFGNPNLKPESSLGYDLGFEQTVTGAAVRFGVTYFRNNIKNLIDDNAGLHFIGQRRPRGHGRRGELRFLSAGSRARVQIGLHLHAGHR